MYVLGLIVQFLLRFHDEVEFLPLLPSMSECLELLKQEQHWLVSTRMSRGM